MSFPPTYGYLGTHKWDIFCLVAKQSRGPTTPHLKGKVNSEVNLIVGLREFNSFKKVCSSSKVPCQKKKIYSKNCLKSLMGPSSIFKLFLAKVLKICQFCS